MSSPVTKAFRLHWHFCLHLSFSQRLWLRKSHKSLSASLAFLPKDLFEDMQDAIESQKPFGFIGISASGACNRHLPCYCKGHKSLSASLAFLPCKPPGWVPENNRESQKPFGFIGISARGNLLLFTSGTAPSQKPFGFIGISAAVRQRFACLYPQARVTKAFRLHWHFCPVRKFCNYSLTCCCVTKAFRLHWHFCLQISLCVPSGTRSVTKAFRLHWHFCLQC